MTTGGKILKCSCQMGSILLPVSDMALEFGFVLIMFAVSEEVAGSLLCAFAREDASAVSSIQLKKGFGLNWHIFISKFKGERNWFSTKKNDYYGQLIPVSLKQTKQIPNCVCVVMAAVQVEFHSKYSTRERVPVQREGGTRIMEKMQKRSQGRLPWRTLTKIVQGQPRGEDYL